MNATKSVNRSGGENRLKFEKFSSRLQRIHVDVVHKVHSTVESMGAIAPESGVFGCYFQDELEECKRLDTSSHFKR